MVLLMLKKSEAIHKKVIQKCLTTLFNPDHCITNFTFSENMYENP